MRPSLDLPESRATRRGLLLLAVVATAALILITIRWTSDTASVGVSIVGADDKAQATDAGKGAGGADRGEKPTTAAKGRDAAVMVEYLQRPSKFEEELLAALEETVN